MGEQRRMGRDRGSDVLELIHEGMTVFDRDGERVGTVTRVYLGSVDQEMDERGLGPSSTGRDTLKDETAFTEVMMRAFDDEDDLPDTLRGRLARQGFVQVEGGLLARDHYILPDLIESVSGDEVYLGVPRDALE